MDIKKISDEFHVTGQIHPEQMHEVAARGYKSILCNRPDNEGAGQPDFAVIRQAASRAGWQADFVPIVHGAAGLKEFQGMEAALQKLPKPILAYCRSGARSEAMYGAVTESVA